MGRFMTALNASIATFRKEFLAAEADTGVVAYPFQRAYGLRAARAFRYSLFWSFYENTPYDGPRFSENRRDAVPGVHTWAAPFKAAMGLYKDVRGVLNPAYRLGEFWATYLYGGRLDPLAGDGGQADTAMPILDATDPARRALAQLWESSHWQTSKTLWSRYGSVLGDAVLQGVDDPANGCVRLRVLHPRHVADLVKDDDGRITRYVLERWVDDPHAPPIPLRNTGQPKKQVLYTEEGTLRDDGTADFATYLNYQPYPWNGTTPAWSEPYGFLPIWHAQNQESDHGWGFPEFFQGWRKCVENDDLVSKLDDQVRKTVESIWFFAGVKQGDLDAAVRRQQASQQNPQPGRQEMLSIASTDPASKAYPLVAPLNIADTSAHLQFLVEQHLQDYPELRYELIRAAGDTNAAALAEAKKPAEAKVEERRAGYDAVLTRALQGMVAIGGARFRQTGDDRLAAYEGFDLDSPGTKPLHFSIGPRPVFRTTPADRALEDTAVATSVKTWTDAGVPLPLALKRAGWADADVAEVQKHLDEQDQQQAEQMNRLADQVPPDGVMQ